VWIGLTGGRQSPFVDFGLFTMLFPSVAVLVAGGATGEWPRINWQRFPMRHLPAALFLMPLLMHLVMLPAAMAFDGELRWQDTRGWGSPGPLMLAGRVAVNAGVGLLVVSALAIFEELGWRAWLLPRVAGRLGPRRGLLVTAALSAFWHTPYALSGIHALQNVSPHVTALLLPAGLMGAALIIGWLWFQTESIWIVSLAHGSLNNWGQYAFKFMPDSLGGRDYLVLGTGNLALLLVGFLLLARVGPPD
jgi:membrane protease YdiL (CAAX protease family)